MSHQDGMDRGTNQLTLKELLGVLLPQTAADLPRHGNASINPLTLAAIAITCWGWSAKRTLQQRVEEAVTAIKKVDFLDETAALPQTNVSRQGLLKALNRCGKSLTTTIAKHVYAQLSQLKGHWRTAGKVTFAMDGTKFAAPRSRQNQARFAVTKNGKTNRKGNKYKSPGDSKKANSVQVLLTIFWHIGSGLPACWRTTDSHGSERKQAEEMLRELPPGARVIGDAEYIGYPLWSAIESSGRSFLVRVGGNATLLKRLIPKMKRQEEIVYCWPEAVKKRGKSPLILRLIHVQTPKGSMCLVTNELDLTDQQACQLYRSRWGIEVFFRTVKQNCRRGKLLCQTPDNVQTELTWTLLGIWASLFVAKLALHQSGQSIDKLSPIRVIDMLSHTLTAHSLGASCTFNLATCIKADESNRTRSKQSREAPPRKKKHRPCGIPKIRDATTEEIKLAKKLLR